MSEEADQSQERPPKFRVVRRLEVEGRLSAFREAQQALKRQGWPTDDAFYEALKDFPPLEETAGTESAEDDEADWVFEIMEEKTPGDIRQAVEWAAANFAAFDIAMSKKRHGAAREILSGAPSSTAVSYLSWAQSSGRAAFFQTVVPKYTAKADDEERRTFEDDRRKQFKLIDEFERFHRERQGIAT